MAFFLGVYHGKQVAVKQFRSQDTEFRQKMDVEVDILGYLKLSILLRYSIFFKQANEAP